MKVAYVSGSYRGKTFVHVIRNILRARWVAIRLWAAGYAVICPHMNTALFPDGAIARKKKHNINYIKGDLAFLDRMIPGYDVLVMLPGWRQSEGTNIEFNRGLNRELKIYFWASPEDRERLLRAANVYLGKQNNNL